MRLSSVVIGCDGFRKQSSNTRSAKWRKTEKFSAKIVKSGKNFFLKVSSST